MLDYFKYEAAVDVNKCLKQVKLTDTLHTLYKTYVRSAHVILDYHLI